MLSSANPALNDSTFTRHVDLTGEDRMTVMGTVNKTIAMVLLTVPITVIRSSPVLSLIHI